MTSEARLRRRARRLIAVRDEVLEQLAWFVVGVALGSIFVAAVLLT